MKNCDVLICGGGLSGLTLALQLSRQDANLSIVVLERNAAPPPDAIFKVGESCVEGATHWLRKTLGMEEYLNQNHVEKLGLRFFGARNGGDFSDRFEIGPPNFPPVPSVQLDRGKFERDLQNMVVERGIDLRLGWRVSDIEISSSGPHRILMQSPNGPVSQSATWVVDATGRSRFLARKLKLQQPISHKVSATWFRVKGRVDLAEMVPSEHRDWHRRTEVSRWYSTNHLLGQGYWIWLIPLSSGNTSVGIMSEDRYHPLQEHRQPETAKLWLAKHEPELAVLLERHAFLDFRTLKNIAYTSEQMFSAERWAMVGEAAAFADPLYSTGSDLIAWANSSVAHLIHLDRSSGIEEDVIDLYNRLFKRLVTHFSAWTLGAYSVFGHDQVMLLKLLWDALSYFIGPTRVLQYEFVGNPESLQRYETVMEPFWELEKVVQGMFQTYAAQHPAQASVPGLYDAGTDCPALGEIADIRTSFFKGMQFLKNLPQMVEKMGSLATSIARILEHPFEPGPFSQEIHLQLQKYLNHSHSQTFFIQTSQ